MQAALVASACSTVSVWLSAQDQKVPQGWGKNGPPLAMAVTPHSDLHIYGKHHRRLREQRSVASVDAGTGAAWQGCRERASEAPEQLADHAGQHRGDLCVDAKTP